MMMLLGSEGIQVTYQFRVAEGLTRADQHHTGPILGSVQRGIRHAEDDHHYQRR